MTREAELVQELASARAALDVAIAIGERMQARIDAATAVAEQVPLVPFRDALLAALRGEA